DEFVSNPSLPFRHGRACPGHPRRPTTPPVHASTTVSETTPSRAQAEPRGWPGQARPRRYWRRGVLVARVREHDVANVVEPTTRDPHELLHRRRLHRR